MLSVTCWSARYIFPSKGSKEIEIVIIIKEKVYGFYLFSDSLRMPFSHSFLSLPPLNPLEALLGTLLKTNKSRLVL